MNIGVIIQKNLKFLLLICLLLTSFLVQAFSWRFVILNKKTFITGGTITYTDSTGLNPRSTTPYYQGSGAGGGNGTYLSYTGGSGIVIVTYQNIL